MDVFALLVCLIRGVRDEDCPVSLEECAGPDEKEDRTVLRLRLSGVAGAAASCCLGRALTSLRATGASSLLVGGGGWSTVGLPFFSDLLLLKRPITDRRCMYICGRSDRSEHRREG